MRLKSKAGVFGVLHGIIGVMWLDLPLFYEPVSDKVCAVLFPPGIVTAECSNFQRRETCWSSGADQICMPVSIAISGFLWVWSVWLHFTFTHWVFSDGYLAISFSVQHLLSLFGLLGFIVTWICHYLFSFCCSHVYTYCNVCVLIAIKFSAVVLSSHLRRKWQSSLPS